MLSAAQGANYFCGLARRDFVPGSLSGQCKAGTEHGDALRCGFSDAGSTPAASSFCSKKLCFLEQKLPRRSRRRSRALNLFLKSFAF